MPEAEERVAEQALQWITERRPDDAAQARRRLDGVRDLGAAISRFPAASAAQVLGGQPRDVADLIEALGSYAPGYRILHTPTTVVAMRSFLVAKFHLFSLLNHLLPEGDALYQSVQHIMFSIIYTLMAEDVYFSCLADDAFPPEIKADLAGDLVALWESGIDRRTSKHLPVLTALWHARDANPPSFGTMEGSSELLRISFEMERDWERFLTKKIADNQARWALEEFLFGLSYEEIVDVRERLKEHDVSAVGRDDVRSLLGDKPRYTEVRETDPRAIYDFYTDRREAALLRKRARVIGPWQTLEGLYITYRLEQEAWTD
jgi:hypothetical protein